MNNNTPPFEIGLKVVALVDGFDYKKGEVRVVKSLHKHCCTWLIDVDSISKITITIRCKIHNTALQLIKGEPLYPQASCFAPYNPYENISSELAAAAMNVGDTADQPVKEIVNN